MDFVDSNANAFMTISRPFKCDPCYCPGLCLCNPQELSISSAGKVIATAKETTGPCCTTGCCLRQFTVTDHSGALMYKLEANECCSKSGGCNCCAPTCFNQGLTIDITSASGELLVRLPSLCGPDRHFELVVPSLLITAWGLAPSRSHQLLFGPAATVEVSPISPTWSSNFQWCD